MAHEPIAFLLLPDLLRLHDVAVVVKTGCILWRIAAFTVVEGRAFYVFFCQISFPVGAIFHDKEAVSRCILLGSHPHYKYSPSTKKKAAQLFILSFLFLSYFF